MTPLTHIQGEGHVAVAYGMEEAVFLDAIMFWYRANRSDDRNFYDGRWWTYNSVKAYEAIFPWWTAGQIRRIIARCREKGALLAGDYNEDRRDRTAWYSPSDELLAMYGESENCICRKQQMQSPKTTDSDDENGKCNIRKPCSNHVETDMTPCSPPAGDAPAPGEFRPKGARAVKSMPVHDPEAFEKLWEIYPRKDSRKATIRAWDKLKPDRGLCRVMYFEIKRQRRSEQWNEAGGKFIPMFYTWLNGRRWENEGVDLSLLDRPQEPRELVGGWLPDPEAPS